MEPARVPRNPHPPDRRRQRHDAELDLGRRRRPEREPGGVPEAARRPGPDPEHDRARSSAGRRRSRTCAAPPRGTRSSPASRSRRATRSSCGTCPPTATRPSSSEPDEFRIDRPNARQHLAFGIGVHFCMGSRLAEMQLRVLWEETLARFRTVEVVGAAAARALELRQGVREPSRASPSLVSSGRPRP